MDKYLVTVFVANAIAVIAMVVLIAYTYLPYVECA